jgi:Cation efflux system protein CusB domain 1
MAVFTPRSVIRAAEPVLYLVPQDRPLVIATQVQPNNIDSVFVGQAVSVRFSAFDQRVTPELFGQVTQVSADAFTDQGSQVSYYRAEIQLPVEAFISTDSRSPMAYLLKPMSDYFTKAFRES